MTVIQPTNIVTYLTDRLYSAPAVERLITDKAIQLNHHLAKSDDTVTDMDCIQIGLRIEIIVGWDDIED